MTITLTLDIYDKNYRLILQKRNNLIDVLNNKNNEQQSDFLLIRLEEFLKINNIKYEDINILSVNNGPASFTLLKVIIAFAKGFKFCFPQKNIIMNNMFELIYHNLNYDLAIVESNLTTCFVYDKNKYFFTNLDKIVEFYDYNNKIITNSKNIADFLKNNYKNLFFVENTIDNIVDLNYQKYLNNNFCDDLEPLYIREPDINVRKNK